MATDLLPAIAQDVRVDGGGGRVLLEREAEVRRLEALIADTNSGGASVLLIEGPAASARVPSSSKRYVWRKAPE
jgi:hypothetical protein